MPFPEKSQPRRLPTPGQAVFCLFGVFCLSLLLRNSEIAIEYITTGLRLCARTVIPSLFPFMVLSDWILSAGTGGALSRALTLPLQRLFGLPEAGCYAVLLGMLCGFPVGARCAVSAYDRGELSKEDCERVLTFSNIPSSAFLISAVGVSLWGNRKFGIALYLTVLSVSVGTGICQNLFRKKRTGTAPPVIPSPTAPPHLPAATAFTASVRAATQSILLVCAYVLFFSALIGTLRHLFTALHLSSRTSAALFSFFELSGGMANAALEDTAYAARLSAFGAGWSGLSVHCQVMSVCDGRGLSFRGYFLSKLLSGALCALLFSLLLHLFPALLIPANGC